MTKIIQKAISVGALVLLLIVETSLVTAQTNYDISSGLFFDGEPYLVVNPANPSHLVIAWMSYVPTQQVVIKVSVSQDGGLTWSSAVSIPHIQVGYTSADPSLAFGSQGQLYLTYVDFDPAGTGGAVVLRRSEDGGYSWSNAVIVISHNTDPGKFPVDRPWVVTDPITNTVYVTSSTPGPFPVAPPYHPYVSVSVDGGITFSFWRYIDTSGWEAGSLIKVPMPSPAVSSGGVFAAVYPSYSPPAPPRYIFARSRNTAVTFEYSTVVVETNPITDTILKRGHLLLVNPADSSHYCFFYIGNLFGDPDILMIESRDGGLSWGNILRVNDDPPGNGKYQDLVWADFDTDGDLVAVWRDRRVGASYTAETPYVFMGAFRQRGSVEFGKNFMVSDTIIPYDTLLRRSGNDFMCVRLRNDTMYAVWGDTRLGKMTIWFAKISLAGTVITGEAVEVFVKEPLPRYFPKSSRRMLAFDTYVRKLTIYDAYGRAAFTALNLEPHQPVAIPDLPQGNYVLWAEGDNKIVTGKFVVGSKD